MTDASWQAAAALIDPVRRALYDYVRRQDHPVTREQAADATSISRSLAAFHLDKLVDTGLLHAHTQAEPDQPRGRGRAPKVYQPADDGLTLTIPERHYELIAAILADAVAEEPADSAEAARRVAYVRGRRRGHDLTTQPATGSQPLNAAAHALAGLGFEPDLDRPDRLTLRNCPFHALAVNQPDLVCGLNHAFIRGLLDGLGAEELQAHLAPRPGACCVEIKEPTPSHA